MKIVVSIVIVVVVLIGAFIFLNQSPVQPASGEGGLEQSSDVSSARQDTLPNAEVFDAQGNSVSIHDVALGAPSVVNSWATWCPFCVDELPDFAELQTKYEGQIKVIAVNRAESQGRAEGYLSDLNVLGGITYLYDSRDVWYREIGGFSMPETLFVDSAGNIVLHKRGPLTFSEMDEIVSQQLLNN